MILLVSVTMASDVSRHALLLNSRIPPTFKLSDPLSPNQVVPFSIAIRHRNVDTLSAMLDEVSNPLSVKYGQYMNHREIMSIIGPNKETIDSLTSFLPPCFTCTNVGDALRCLAPVHCIEQSFETSLVNVKHISSGLELVRQIGNFTIPSILVDIIEFVSPFYLYSIPSRRKSPVTPVSATAFNYAVGPETLNLIYNITESGDARSSQGVAEFQAANWPYLPSDLSQFSTLTNMDLIVSKFFGPPPNNSGEATDEASLDIQYIAAVGADNTNWYWEETTWMYEFVLDVQNQTDRPAVLSLSYAWSEAQQCGSITDSSVCSQLQLTNNQYVARINTEFMKVGLLGTTIVCASGDSGAHGRTDESCVLNPWMHPDYPAASPYVTSVGGTEMSNQITKKGNTPLCQDNACIFGGTEVAISYELAQFASGGGFSTVSPRPAYQNTVVQEYITNPASKMPNATKHWGDMVLHIYNSSNRGFPDVSAQGHNFLVILNGGTGQVSGTSASAPTWGGIIGLLNAHRIRKGRALIGFANPLLYSIYAATNGEAFQDITVGNNECTESGCLCRNGFHAAKGWDAVSGLGSPNVGKIIEAMDVLDVIREKRIAEEKTQL